MEKKKRSSKTGEKLVAIATAVSIVAGGTGDSSPADREREALLQPEAITEIYVPPEAPVLAEPAEPEEEKKRRQEISAGRKAVLILAAALVYIVLMGILSALLVSLPAIAAGAVKLVAGIALSAVLALTLLKIFNPDKTLAEILKSGKPLKAVLIFAAALAVCIGLRILVTKLEIPSFIELAVPAAVMAACLGAFSGRG